MNKKSLSVFFSVFLFVPPIFNSCSSPESPTPAEKKYANLQITIAREPVYLIFNWSSYDATGEYIWKGKINVVIHEINGVKCDIKSIDLKFARQNYTYEPSSFVGGILNAYGKLEIPINLSASYGGYEKIRIVATGTDENGHSISASKDFSIENLPGVDGTYKGEIAGTQFGWIPFTSVLTMNIKQENKKISGTWHTEQGTSGTFEGEFDTEGELSWQFDLDATQYNPSYGIYKSTGQIKNWGYYLIGSFKGESGSFGKIDASFSVNRL